MHVTHNLSEESHRALMGIGGATHLGCELPLGILGSPQVLDEFFILHCTLKWCKAMSVTLLSYLRNYNFYPSL